MRFMIEDIAAANSVLTDFYHFHDAVLTQLRLVTQSLAEPSGTETLSSAMALQVVLSSSNHRSSDGQVLALDLEFHGAVDLLVDWRGFNDCDWGIDRVDITEGVEELFPFACLKASFEWSVLRNDKWQAKAGLSFRFQNAVLRTEKGDAAAG